MTESRLIIALLAVMSVCLVIIAVALFRAISEFRETAQRLRAVLPEAEQMLREARHSLRRTRRLLERADATARLVDGVVRKACAAAADALDRVALLKSRAESFIGGYVGNGTRAEPRRRHT